MSGRPVSEFSADPVTTKPLHRFVAQEPVRPPSMGDSRSSTGGAVKSLFPAEGSSRPDMLGGKTLPSVGPEMVLGPNSLPGSAHTLPHTPHAPGINDWQQHNQIQQFVNQQALLNQLQSQIQLNQGLAIPNTSPLQQQESALASLLSQQLQPGSFQEAALRSLDGNGVSFPNAVIPPHWPRVPFPRSPPGGFAGSPIPGIQTFPELPGLKHGLSPHEERKHLRGHGHSPVHSLKGRAIDVDGQGGTVEKLRREVARLQSEVDRLEKEVARQKALREAERIEFTDAKDRVRHSWAVDRDDFARVKSLLKTKNAEHHAQSGRLSQQLKEADAVNRGLKELCARHNIPVPPELEVSHTRRHGVSPGQHSSGSMPSLPSSQISNSTFSEAHSLYADVGMPSRTPSEASFDSDILERLGSSKGRHVVSSCQPSGSQPPSPMSPARAVLQMMRQVQHLVPADEGRAGSPKPSPKIFDLEEAAAETNNSDSATHFASQAAAALNQLANALAAARPLSPTASQSASDIQSLQQEHPDGLGQYALADTNLNRMSLQSWVKTDRPTPSDSSRSCSPSATKLHEANGGTLGYQDPMAAPKLPSSDGSCFQVTLNAQSGITKPCDERELQMWTAAPHNKQNSTPDTINPKPSPSEGHKMQALSSSQSF